MTATFSASLATTKDQLRLELGDIDMTAAILQDETYDALYAANAGASTATRRYRLTLLAAVRAVMAAVNRDPDKVEVTGTIKVEWARRLAVWAAIEQRYMTLTGDVGAAPSYAAASGALTYQGVPLTPLGTVTALAAGTIEEVE